LTDEEEFRSMSAQGRRTRSKKHERNWLTAKTLWIVGAVLAVIILAPVLMGLFDNDDPPEVLQGLVQELPDEGRDHVPDGTEIQYDTDPPTSGPHYARWAQPGLYREDIPAGLLVHNLEHGHIVIYYSPSLLSNEAAAKLTDLTDRYTGDWEAVLALPRQDSEFELILTAWNHKLELEEYDEELVDAFVDAYRGRGPENPVR
jgi:hypothetical protein